MALNDKPMRNMGTDVHPGVANPTAHSNNSDPMQDNFVTDPTTDDRGAGAGPNFEGDRMAARNFKQTAGVIEGRPGIIETTNIDPLNENSNKDDGWANAKSNPAQQGGGIAATATSMVTDAANKTYEVLTGQKK
ncbi:hypothetical protein Moror_8956 [Moniliophthora roreri MCA 2997]|uniref:Uncharacterized protein n=2 Tax=Moniliophthora roreri TaxID=221103 RepID=V2X1R0_MONRO|nr:hypothetical protein Moror_8956 [Moniliophthora roreri MCA 2997]KAI3610843.1 hypothetical protein WG66_007131 [Moniliophthora roreri]